MSTPGRISNVFIRRRAALHFVKSHLASHALLLKSDKEMRPL